MFESVNDIELFYLQLIKVKAFKHYAVCANTTPIDNITVMHQNVNKKVIKL